MKERCCEYKGRIYSVREDGSIYRHAITGTPGSRLDEVWTFGRKDRKSGYMLYGDVRVHQVVATAFHGKPESPNMVVDHIDTNRCNNRPENLRWVTRMDNLLDNLITCKRIEYVCGSIEAFKEDPGLLFNLPKRNNDVSWMRPTSREESKSCLENLSIWAKTEAEPSGGSLGEWVFHRHQAKALFYTPVQEDWTQQCWFPQCIGYVCQGQNFIEEYLKKLEPGSQFLFSTSYHAYVVESRLFPEDNKFRIISEKANNNGITASKPWFLFEVYLRGNQVVHRHVGTYGRRHLEDCYKAMNDLTKELPKETWKYKW